MLEATAAAEDSHFWFLHLRRTARSLLTSALAGIQPRLIVDCGAGTGRNLEWLSGFGPAVGIERSPTGLAFGRRLQRRMLQGSVTRKTEGREAEGALFTQEQRARDKAEKDSQDGLRLGGGH